MGPGEGGPDAVRVANVRSDLASFGLRPLPMEVGLNDSKTVVVIKREDLKGIGWDELG